MNPRSTPPMAGNRKVGQLECVELSSTKVVTIAEKMIQPPEALAKGGFWLTKSEE